MRQEMMMSSAEFTRDRKAAWCAGLPALLFVIVIAHHPVPGVDRTASVDGLSAAIARIAVQNATFHAGVLLMLSAQAIGLWSFAGRLGLDRLLVRTGAFFYGISTLSLFLAGIVDGFATPLLGHMCSDEPARCANALTTSLSVEFTWIQAFTKVGLATQALGLAFWSAALALGWQGRSRLAGVFGLLIALLPLVALLTTDASLGPARLALLIAPGCVWTFGAAIFLWRGALLGPTRKPG
jgi:hypothetical protein